VKKSISFILIAVMVLCMLPSGAFALDTWDGTADETWYNDTDTTFTISTAEQLAGLAKLVDAGKTFHDKVVRLTDDIDLADFEHWNPIGTSSANFMGEFDGGKHTITNLNSTTSGLFDTVRQGYIHDFTIDGVTITGGTGGGVARSISMSVAENITVKNAVFTNNGGFAISGACSISQFKNVDAEDIAINTNKDVVGGMFENPQAMLYGYTTGEGDRTNTGRWLEFGTYYLTGYPNNHYYIPGTEIATETVVTEDKKIGSYNALNTANPKHIGTQEITFLLNSYFEGCDGRNISITVNRSSGEAYVGGFMAYNYDSWQYSGDAAICQGCTISGLEMNLVGDANFTAGGFVGLRSGMTGYQGNGLDIGGFEGCSVEGVVDGKNGNIGGFVGESRNYNGGTPATVKVGYENATANVDIKVAEGGAAKVGGFAGYVDTATKNHAGQTIPQSFEGCKALGDVYVNCNDENPDGEKYVPGTTTTNAQVGGLIGSAKTPGNGGDIGVDNCQVAALNQLEELLEKELENEILPEDEQEKVDFINNKRNELANKLMVGNYTPNSTGSANAPTINFEGNNRKPDPAPAPAPAPKSSGSGISVTYNGGNSFSTSNSAVPTGVEIDNVPVSFTGNGSSFTVSGIPAGAKWITVRWNSTSVTTNFTPNGAYFAEVEIPKTGDMPIWAAVAEFLGF